MKIKSKFAGSNTLFLIHFILTSRKTKNTRHLKGVHDQTPGRLHSFFQYPIIIYFHYHQHQWRLYGNNTFERGAGAACRISKFCKRRSLADVALVNYILHNNQEVDSIPWAVYLIHEHFHFLRKPNYPLIEGYISKHS